VVKSGEDRAMPTATCNGVELWYETFGGDDDPPLLLVMGLGAQATAWDAELCNAFTDRGFRVIRFDNRDVGLSTKIESAPIDFFATIAKVAAGEPVDAPYRLSDMAADAVGLLDHLGIAAAHVVGASMGGMIAQTIAIEHPERVLTLTSIMSNTGNFEYGNARAEAMAVLLEPAATDRDGAIERSVRASQVIGSPDHFDEERARERAAAAYDRCFFPVGIGRQLIGIHASGSREDALRELTVPTLVIHGTEDPLVEVSGGERTAELIPGSELLLVEGMGHDLPQVFWSQIVEAVTRLATKAAVA
jgi:pimeloyl-ACP methyl ester carboxylesterase